jgi:hypothetical protein
MVNTIEGWNFKVGGLMQQSYLQIQMMYGSRSLPSNELRNGVSYFLR